VRLSAHGLPKKEASSHPAGLFFYAARLDLSPGDNAIGLHHAIASLEQSVETETVQYIISDRPPMSDEEWEQRYCTPREKQISE
jgi:hypothetical protein